MSATGCVHQLALSNKMKPVHVLAAATLLLSLSQQRLGPAAVLRLCLVGPVFLLQASVQYYFLTLAVLVSSYFAEASDLTSAALLLLAAPFFHDFKAETTFLCSLAQISLYAALQGEGEELMLLAGEVALSLFLCRLNSQLKEVKSQVTAAEEEVAALRRDEEGLKAQLKFQRFQKNPTISTRAGALLSKLKTISSQKALGSSGDVSDLTSNRPEREEDSADPIIHPNTEFVLLTHETEGDEGKAGSFDEEGSVQSKHDFTHEDIDDLITSVMSRDIVPWHLNKQKREVDNLSERLHMRNVLSQRVEVAPGVSRKAYNPLTRRVTVKVTAVDAANGELTVLLQGVGEWNFDTLAIVPHTTEPLKEVGYCAFRQLGLYDNFTIKQNVLLAFLTRVEHKYRVDNFYHNSIHAADVLNSCIFLLCTDAYKSGKFLELEMFGMVVAAIGHDVGHPGFNNAFLVNSMDSIALKYNDRSVLENMHSALTFQILLKSDSNLVADLTKPNYMAFRKVVIALILATDLQKHMAKQAEFKAALEDDTKDLGDADYRLLILEMCLKCADLGHGAKATDIHKRWTSLITKEFFQQGDTERQKKLPISPICDRELVVIPKSQVGFLNFMVLPIYDLWEKMIFKIMQHEDSLVKICCSQIRGNVQFWSEETQRLEEGRPTFALDDLPPPLKPK